MAKVSHSNFKKKTLLEIHQTYHNVRAWNNETGLAYTKEGFPVKYGKVGSADITGILSDGRRLEIEIKVGKDRQRPEQQDFEKMIVDRGGVYAIINDKTGIKEQLCQIAKIFNILLRNSTSQD